MWDLIKLADYLTARKDVDPTKIGITGISLGGHCSYSNLSILLKKNASVLFYFFP